MTWNFDKNSHREGEAKGAGGKKIDVEIIIENCFIPHEAILITLVCNIFLQIC